MEYLLGQWEVRKGLKMRVSLAEHRHKLRLDIRKWYLDADGAWYPGRKGVVVSPEYAEDFSRMVFRGASLLNNKMPIGGGEQAAD